MDINQEIRKQIDLGFNVQEMRENLRAQNFSDDEITKAISQNRNRITNPASSGGGKTSPWVIIGIVLIVIRIIIALARS